MEMKTKTVEELNEEVRALLLEYEKCENRLSRLENLVVMQEMQTQVRIAFWQECARDFTILTEQQRDEN